MNVLDRLRAILETVTAPEDDALDGLLARLDAEELDRLEAAAHQGPDAFDAVVGELIADEVLLRPHAPPHDLERERAWWTQSGSGNGASPTRARTAPTVGSATSTSTSMRPAFNAAGRWGSWRSSAPRRGYEAWT